VPSTLSTWRCAVLPKCEGKHGIDYPSLTTTFNLTLKTEMAGPKRREKQSTGADLRQITGGISDIEDRRRLDEKLRRSEALLTEGQRLSSTGTFSWRTATEEMAFSEELHRIFELDQSPVVTFEQIFSRIHPEDAQPTRERLAHIRAGTASRDNEMRLLMPDGRVKYVRVITRDVIDQDGHPERLGAIQDITRGRLAEEALIKARAEVAQVAKVTSLGVLMASIAHEVNQPLAAIITNGEASLRWLARSEPDLEKVEENARRVVADARRAADIIDRIRAMATRKSPTHTMLSLDSIVEESVHFLRYELQSKGVSVEVDLSPGLPQIAGDRIQLQQVVVNLVVNAVQAMAQSEAPRRNIVIRTLLSAPETLGCTVEDSGPGLGQSALPQIFDPFFTTKDGGMGMGLAISQSIVEAHGGRIRADNASSLGGARFSIGLPVNMATQ
jgi:PAS domain S-box-containing protein